MIRVRALDTLRQMAHGNAAAITPIAIEFSTQRAAGSWPPTCSPTIGRPPPANARSSVCSSIPSRRQSKRSPRAKW